MRRSPRSELLARIEGSLEEITGFFAGSCEQFLRIDRHFDDWILR